MKKSIGILYICTGKYHLFWQDFFLSFEKYFLPNTEKRYYVFTDQDVVYGEDQCSRIKVIHTKPLPWPLITLLRFNYFLSIEDELRENDYLMFSNANIVCEDKVSEAEFLPVNDEMGMAFVKHPGYYYSKIIDTPLERSKRSLAYVPYNCGTDYVIGAMFAGKTKDFLRMCSILNDRINSDLAKGVIAKWHDESHLNRYIINQKNYKLLSASYCYPCGVELPIERKICAVSKKAKFDVDGFKNKNLKIRNLGIRKKYILLIHIKNRLLYLRDCLFKKNVERL